MFAGITYFVTLQVWKAVCKIYFVEMQIAKKSILK